MKTIKLINLFILTLFCQVVLSQNNVLIYPKNTLDSEKKSTEIIKKSDANLSVDFVSIDLEKIPSFDQFVLQFGKNNVLINKERIDVRGINDFCFVGKNEKDGSSIIFSVLDNDIQGIIHTNDGVYQIETIGKGDYAVVKIDHSKLKENCDHLHDNSPNINHENEDNADKDFYDLEDGDTNTSSSLRSTSPYECKIRVLVFYTPAAQSSVSNIRNTVLLAIAETNQGFINSNVNYWVELAYAGLTNYTETNSTTDKSRFRNNNDGYMDEVHSLRNKYSADVCVLLTNYNDGICGEAYGIGVSESDAFCVVKAYNCATGYYSFGHEIGHLLGCRHDTYVDPTTTPFAYGHGYVYSSGGWRTIMAYANACSSCSRILYWSNPNVTYNGVAMGTTATNNNTRVWNERSNTIMAFRQPENNVTITSAEISSSLYSDVIAKQNITTSGTVIVSNNKILDTRASNSITLQPGFSVELGAEFSAQIENVYDCGSSAQLARVLIENNDREINDYLPSIEKVNDFSYLIFPNSTYDFINVNYSLTKETSLSIELINFLGQKIKTILPKQNLQTGTYNIQIPVSDFTVGTYFLTISSEKQTRTEKIIINK